VGSERAKQELLRRLLAYHRKVEHEFARKRAKIEQLVASMHTST